jgi:predicted short-subunit dehydrogenase-like oxidoreductase (DUF2520 family)
MKAGIIGAGKLGCALAIGLQKKGIEIIGIYSRNSESVNFLADQLGITFENSLESAVTGADIVFITVPDGQIESIAQTLSDSVENSHISQKVFCHCSGALGAEVLAPLAELGAFTAAFHPIQTFADRAESWKGLEGIYFGFEGMEEAKGSMENIVKIFDSNMLVIKAEDKPLYHAAACILSNYTVTLSYIAGKLFEQIGIDVSSGIKAFAPLVEKTISNIQGSGSLNALTGPISRGDYTVVEKHIRAMEEKTPELVYVYRELGGATVKAALEKGSIDSDTAHKLLEILY